MQIVQKNLKMQIQNYDYFLENKPSKIGLKTRKINTLPNYCVIKGSFSCGKKSLCLNLINDDFVFLDLSDIRLSNLDIYKFIEKNNIYNLVCFNAHTNFALPSNIKKCFITTHNNDFSQENFTDIKLHYLDYEEFISFSKQNQTNYISEYLLLGQNPINIDKTPYEAHKNIQNILKQHYPLNKIQILCKVADYIGYKSSILKIFNDCKIKIGKNDFFACLKEFENNFILYWIKHVDKNIKKPYFTDFAMKNAISIKKDFTKNYENLIANELIMNYDEIFFSDDFDFIIPNANIAVIADAFVYKDLISIKQKKLSLLAKKNNINNVLLLSLNENFTFKYDNINIICLKLDEWLLTKDNNDWN